MQTLTINRPDDWHVHLRDGAALQHTAAATAKHFSRALVMPNLKPALTTLESLLQYRARILNALPHGSTFTPLMTFYLNEQIDADELYNSRQHSFIVGAKLYPAGATTNAEEGARSLKAIYPLLDVLQENNQVLQIHGEVTHGDIFFREKRFLEEELTTIVHNFPKLRVVLEHISSRAATEFIAQSREGVAATITAHHLVYDRNDMLAGGLKPHFYCLPVLKQSSDRRALQKAAVSGNSKFFAGTDSAPHAIHHKESSCGCAGIYTAPYAIPLYTQVFAEADRLDQLNAFLSLSGAHFYQVPINTGELTLIKKSQLVPQKLAFGKDEVIPVAAGCSLPWSVYE